MIDLAYRQLKIEDIELVLELMYEIRPPVAGLHTKTIYEKFCKYVFKTDKIVFVIAEFKHQIIGFSITIIDYKRFWREFFSSHYILAIYVVTNKVLNLFKSRNRLEPLIENNDIEEYLSKDHLNISWKDSSPKIGKVLYIAVKKEFRNMKVGKGLYEYRHKVLLEKGVERVDGKINQNNIAPIKLAFSEGRKIVRDKNGMLFSSFYLK